MWWHFDSSCVSPHCWILHSLVAVGDLMDLMRKLFHCIPSTRRDRVTWHESILFRRRNNQARKQLEANNVQPDWVPFGSDVDGECGKWQFIPTLKWWSIVITHMRGCTVSKKQFSKDSLRQHPSSIDSIHALDSTGESEWGSWCYNGIDTQLPGGHCFLFDTPKFDTNKKIPFLCSPWHFQSEGSLFVLQVDRTVFALHISVNHVGYSTLVFCYSANSQGCR